MDVDVDAMRTFHLPRDETLFFFSYFFFFLAGFVAIKTRQLNADSHGVRST